MADVAIEVITPATNFSETGNAALYVRESLRSTDSPTRSVAPINVNKESAPKEKSLSAKPPSARKAWGKVNSTSGREQKEVSPQKNSESENGKSRKDTSTILIPQASKVSRVVGLHLAAAVVSCSSPYDTLVRCIDIPQLYCLL